MNAKIFNMGLLLISLLIGILHKDDLKLVRTDFLFSIFVAVGATVIVVLSCTVQSLYGDGGNSWQRPSLSGKFVFMKQPLQAYYIASLMFGAYACGLFLQKYSFNSFSSSYILYAAGSLGSYLGVLIATKIFKR